MDLHQELFMRVKAFIQSVANVCPSCPRRSDATCPVCVCQPAARLVKEIEQETGTGKAVEKSDKKLTNPEIVLLRFIRHRELKGSQFQYCISRIKIKGLEVWEKHRALKALVANGLVEVCSSTTLGGNHKHAITVIDRRDEIDKEIGNVTN